MTAGLLLLLYLPGCQTTWQIQQATTAQVLADEEPDEVMVTLYDGTELVLREPSISQETLQGREVKRGGIGPDFTVSRSLPLSSVDHVAVRKTDTGKTVKNVVAVALAVPFMIWMFCCLFVPR